MTLLCLPEGCPRHSRDAGGSSGKPEVGQNTADEEPRNMLQFEERNISLESRH